MTKPSLACCARSVTKATIKVVKGKIQGKPVLVSVKERDTRLSICNECEHLEKGICQICGCVMKIKCFLTVMCCPSDDPKW